MLKAEEQVEVKEEIMYDRGLLRSKPSLDRDEPFPARCRLFIWQIAAVSFLGRAARLPPPTRQQLCLAAAQAAFGNADGRVRLQCKQARSLIMLRISEITSRLFYHMVCTRVARLCLRIV